MMYRPTKAPGRRFFHPEWTTGFFGNSDRGSDHALELGYGWADNDYHLSEDLVWLNCHGYPETTWTPKGTKTEEVKWRVLAQKRKVWRGHTYRLQTGAHRLRYNASIGLKTEIEIKNLSPIKASSQKAAIARLARQAKAAYGANWRNECVVKVMDTQPNALRTLQYAHAAGFKTMLSVHGRNRYKTYAGYEYITWLRGSAVAKKA